MRDPWELTEEDWDAIGDDVIGHEAEHKAIRDRLRERVEAKRVKPLREALQRSCALLAKLVIEGDRQGLELPNIGEHGVIADVLNDARELLSEHEVAG